ncbi:lipolytic protein G-D-S-L family [Paenibacillus curdlanolyticus YK9]|uniref:Lipolytic protein G-D-S-L family n=1 Tax=Paenibacillus curdlanolyticus YK9 TaxID=717606 RepID=E0ID20_9BACL|nr:SGNH/GDSL hydrolase family protein [Paenibacillus curdlanolyticus]EFM09475.1 lipolytic protein G-D-S-L family [Paenibacillus curdlanolyticus YK9]
MNYLALGDSITYGHSPKTKELPFPIHVQALLAQASPVQLRLHAKPGWTSSKLLRSLSVSADRFCEAPRLATIIIGGNDVIKHTLPLLTGRVAGLHAASEQLFDNVMKMINQIAQPNTTILLGTLYNPFPNWWVMETVTEMINKTIRKISMMENVHLLDLEQLFRGNEKEWIDGYRYGRFLDLRPIGNPIHPNLAGHRAIAEEIVRVYQNILYTMDASMYNETAVSNVL